MLHITLIGLIHSHAKEHFEAVKLTQWHVTIVRPSKPLIIRTQWRAFLITSLHFTYFNYLFTHLWVKENFWSQKSLITNVHYKWCLGDGVNTIIFLHPLGRIRIILCKLFCNIWTYITKSFFDSFGCFQGLFWGNTNLTFS